LRNSGRPDSNRQRLAWKASALPLSYTREQGGRRAPAPHHCSTLHTRDACCKPDEGRTEAPRMKPPRRLEAIHRGRKSRKNISDESTRIVPRIRHRLDRHALPRDGDLTSAGRRETPRLSQSPPPNGAFMSIAVPNRKYTDHVAPTRRGVSRDGNRSGPHSKRQSILIGEWDDRCREVAKNANVCVSRGP
jgi:hypothetical protein